MSRFDEMDHKLGRHEGAPCAECTLCDPTSAQAIALVKERYWDFEGGGQPSRLPDFGSLWYQNPERMSVFVTPETGATSSIAGFWVNAWDIPDLTMMIPNKNRLDSQKKPLKIIDGISHAEISGVGEIQMEFGSGAFHERVTSMAVITRLPAEDVLRSPLGADLSEWAEDKNHATLLVQMKKDGMIPISEIEHTKRTDASGLVVMTGTVKAIKRPERLSTDQMRVSHL